MDSNQTDQPFKGFLGRVKRALGWATADRRVEAEGSLEELSAKGVATAPADAAPGDAAAVVDEAELHVRNDHGDLAPSAEPTDQPVPADPKKGG